MLYVLCIVAAAILVAGALEANAGLLIGAFMGWLAALMLKMRSKIQTQEKQLKDISQKLHEVTLSHSPLESAVIPAETASVVEDAFPADESPKSAIVNTEDEEVIDSGEGSGSTLSELVTIAAASQADVSLTKTPDTPASAIEKALPENAWLEGSKPAPESTFFSKEIEKLSGLAEKARQWVVAYFTGGNLMVRVGILILFFGVAFLLKYAAERSVVPVEFRYFGLMLAATVLLVVGWRLRTKSQQYSLVIQGGAIGILYLVVFAAYQMHHLLSPTAAFVLMMSVVVLAAVIAILQDAVWLAAVGVTGGFLAPVLVSTGDGSHIGLFSYYLLLNLGIALVSFYRSWRFLNWLGFIFTFGIGTAWGAQSYQSEFFSTTEPFLISFYLIYTLIPLLFAIKQPPQLKGLVDGTLVFGTPVAFMGLQSQLVDGYVGFANILAVTSGLMGALYLGLAYAVWRRAGLRLLAESYIALALAFLTMAIPLGFDGRVTSAIWAIEGAALIWVGLRQQRLLSRISGLGLMFLSAWFFFDEPSTSRSSVFLLNADFIGSLLLAFAAVAAARIYHQYQENTITIERRYAAEALRLWGFCWWFGGGFSEIDRHFHGLKELVFNEGLVALTCALCWLAFRRRHSMMAAVLGVVSVSVGVLVLALQHDFNTPTTMWINLNMLSSFVLAGTALWMALFSWKNEFSNIHAKLARVQYVMLWLGIILLLGFGLGEINHHAQPPYKGGVFLLYAMGVLLPMIAIHKKFAWNALTQPVLLMLPVYTGALFFYVDNDFHLWQFAGWLIFPLGLAALAFSFKYLQRIEQYPLGLLHLATMLVLTVAAAWQLAKLFQPLSSYETSIWSISSWGIVFCLALVLLRKCRGIAWPFRTYDFELNQLLPRIILGLLILWIIASNLRDPGNMGPILNLPFINPLDLTTLAAVALIYLWLHRYDTELTQEKPQLRYIVPGALGFLWLNCAVIRACHLILDIPFRFEPMFHSFAVESAISVLWGTVGLITMISATRKGWRVLWIVGGGLMVAVVIKLFTVDMTGSGTVARIVAFITVGILLLIVGYFAPVPPKSADKDIEERASV